MFVHVMKSKIHRVKVTEADLNYIGSITIDPLLMDAANFFEGERVQIVNVNNGDYEGGFVFNKNVAIDEAFCPNHLKFEIIWTFCILIVLFVLSLVFITVWNMFNN